MGVLYNLRRSYEQKELQDNNLPQKPLQLFKQWFDEINSGNYDIEANAMSLATATKDGKPSTRMLLLKNFDEKGFVFFTNYESRKADELLENPNVALLFFWYPLERQVRIEGIVEKISSSESEAYFRSRPRDSKIGAWISSQSKTIPNREFLKKEFDYQNQRYNDEIPLPPYWGGYGVIPHYFEFWQGRTNRLHDRICYKLKNGKWETNRLAP